MKKTFYFVLLFLCGFVAGCKKDTGNGNGQVRLISTRKGSPTGSAVSATIGAQGGEFLSADGTVRVIVPGNAVQNPTTFTIQPINNTLDSSSGSGGYRLTPEGTSFSQPVTLVFKYKEADYANSSEDALVIAWQRPDGTWKVEPSRLDKAAKTITIQTTHFSDWIITGAFRIRVPYEDILPDESAELRITGVTRESIMADVDGSYVREYGLTRAGNWRIIEGPGNLEATSGGNIQGEAKYSAPRVVNGRKLVVVTAELEGFNKIKDPGAPGGERPTGLMILFGRFYVSTDNYVSGYFNGAPIDFSGGEVVGTMMSNMMTIRAENSQMAINIVINGSGPGTFPAGDILLPGTTWVTVDMTSGAPSWGTTFFQCPGPQTTYAPNSSSRILEWPAVGGYAQGFYNGTVHQNEGSCGVRSAPLNLQFRFLRRI